MLRAQLENLPKSSFLTFGGLLMLLLFTAITVYGVLPKYKAWAKTQQSYTVLAELDGSAVDLNTQIAHMESQVSKLERQLNGDSASLPTRQFESHVIGQLQQVAWKHNVQLAGIVPRQGERVERFREMLFDVQLSGDYFDIHDLLNDFQTKLGFVVVKQFDMRPGRRSDERLLDVKLTLASYRMEEGR